MGSDKDATDPFEILEDINTLLANERQLYKTLESSVAAGSTSTDYDDIIEQINSIAAEVSRLFSNIYDSYDDAASYNSYKKAELADKIKQAKSMEKDLLDRKSLHNNNESNHAGKIRAFEINTYYSSSYRAQAEIMKIIIIACVPLVIITLLSKSNILTSNIADVLLSIVLIIVAGVVAFKVYDLTIRNNMNFDEYEWGRNPSSLPVSTGIDASSATIDSTDDYLIHPGCVDASCCSVGTYYVKSSKKCVAGINPLEGFADIDEYVKKRRSVVVPFNTTQTNYVYVNN